MGIHRYKAWNGPMPTTAAQQVVTTGSSVKTMQQIATPSTRMITIISWGYSLSAPPAGTVELLETDVAATITAYTSTAIQPLVPGIPSTTMLFGTTAQSGYTASAEGSITTTRVFDSQTIGGSAGDNELNYDYQFLPDERPIVNISKFLRIRVTMTNVVNMQCYICWEE